MKHFFQAIVVSTVSTFLLSTTPKMTVDGVTKQNETSINYKCYFGCDDGLSATGVFNKTRLLAASKKKICVKDLKTSTAVPVYSFDFTYCERGVFEDSTGLPTLITDYNFVPFIGDSITTNWQKALEERLYKGDTLRIENIVIRKDGKLVKLNERLKLAVE
jgi:hypothetical protein